MEIFNAGINEFGDLGNYTDVMSDFEDK